MGMVNNGVNRNNGVNNNGLNSDGDLPGRLAVLPRPPGSAKSAFHPNAAGLRRGHRRRRQCHHLRGYQHSYRALLATVHLLVRATTRERDTWPATAPAAFTVTIAGNTARRQ